MDIVYVAGFVGSIASIITLFVAAPDWKSRVVHAFYVLLVTTLASAYAVHSSKLSEYTEIEKQAHRILKSADLSSDGSTRGFVLLSLSFLEKNKQQFPDTYDSARKLAISSGVLESKQEDAMDRLHQGWRLKDVGEAMQSLLAGIAGKPAPGGD
ncbi:MAG: hypothetical protein ABS39_11240 [Acidovorax sp. SCN 65-28]|uniref:hypothetical protein n=1 Tax=Acidovorax sp. TaxID=1872122 RepID=UPI00086B45B3|nr:hypothetical protein [Acidovorax sp.]MBN9627124.1 hypothetical protein [Acidovorax sp.]ODS77003.1 MAG: hypothetical protein ABS39_11240 [Acidovorax sp. SCN 65-28]